MCSKIERPVLTTLCITAFAISIVVTNPWEPRSRAPMECPPQLSAAAVKAVETPKPAAASDVVAAAPKAVGADPTTTAQVPATTTSTSAPASVPTPADDKTPCVKPQAGPKKKFAVGPEITHVIIDVGTNVSPEFGKYAKDDPNALYIMIEPLTVNEAQANGCRGFPKSRCILIGAAVSNIARWAVFRIATTSECSSLLANGTGCGQEASQMFVSLITLDEVIDQLPDNLPIKLIAMDCQGADFYALASLKRHAARVMAFIIECQDLPLGDSRMIYGTESKNCGIIHDCAISQLGFQFVRCTSNVPHVREVNCVYLRPDAPRKWTDLARDLRHGMNIQLGDQELTVKGQCPLDEWNAMPTICR